MQEHAKAIAGALTTLIVFVAAEIGFDLPDGMTAAVGTILTGAIVWYVTNKKSAPSEAESASANPRSPFGV